MFDLRSQSLPITECVVIKASETLYRLYQIAANRKCTTFCENQKILQI